MTIEEIEVWKKQEATFTLPNDLNIDIFIEDMKTFGIDINELAKNFYWKYRNIEVEQNAFKKYFNEFNKDYPYLYFNDDNNCISSYNRAHKRAIQYKYESVNIFDI